MKFVQLIFILINELINIMRMMCTILVELIFSTHSSFVLFDKWDLLLMYD